MLYRLLDPLMTGFPYRTRFFVRDYGDYILLAIAALIILRILRFRRGGRPSMGSALVLRRFTVNEVSTNGIVIDISGRRAGLIAWLLTAIGFDAETTLTMNDDELSLKTSRLSGQTHQLIPLPNISSTRCGYHKPIGAMIFGIIFVILGLLWGFSNESGMALALGLIPGAAFLAIYWLSRSMLISVETVGGTPLGLRFKPGVIGGVPVDIRKVLQTIRLINQHVVAAQGRVAV
jgi:hypothetical protein